MRVAGLSTGDWYLTKGGWGLAKAPAKTKAKPLRRAGRSRAVAVGWIEQAILWARGQKVMLSNDLARLYGVEPRALVQAVKRNLDRFSTGSRLTSCSN